MAAQRPPTIPPALRASAADLPLRDNSVDAAMAVLTIHHWDDELERGLEEMRRVARDAVVILTYDPLVSGEMWLMADYLPEVAELDRRSFPSPQQLVSRLGGGTRIEIVPVSRDTPDWMLGSFWAHPERVLDEQARNATSGFARMDASVVQRVVRDVRRDLESGLWDERHGHLRKLDAFDAGLRLVVERTVAPGTPGFSPLPASPESAPTGPAPPRRPRSRPGRSRAADSARATPERRGAHGGASPRRQPPPPHRSPRLASASPRRT